MILFILLSVGLVFSITATFAQTKNIVNYEQLGIQFTIPEGWVGQEVETGYLIGSQIDPGFALISTHQAKFLEEIKTMLRQGINDASGTLLQLKGEPEQVGKDGMGAELTGTLEGQTATAYVLGRLNPYGVGVTVMAATTPDLYAEKHKQLARQIAASLIFSEAKILPIAEQWRQKFSNARLTYLDSYYNAGGSYEGYNTGGGYSTQTQIHLCAQGHFKYKSSSSVSVDTGGAFGSSKGNSQGDGAWEITGNSQDQAVLKLNFHNGEIHEYTLTYQNNKIFLNGERFFITYGNDNPDYRPDCF